MNWVDVLLCGVVALFIFDKVLKLGKRRPWIRWKKPKGTGITFDGDPEAIPRTFWNDDWKEQWNWILLSVSSRSVGVRYHMHYCSGGKWYRYLWNCERFHVALQLGPDPVTFVAMHSDSEGSELLLKQVIQPTSRQLIERWEKRSGYRVTFI